MGLPCQYAHFYVPDTILPCQYAHFYVPDSILPCLYAHFLCLCSCNGHASRDIQRIQINLHSNSLNVSARVLNSRHLLSMHFSCARELRHSSEIAKIKTRAETFNVIGTAG